MKKISIFLAALGLIAASCNKTEIAESQTRIMHLTASVEEPAPTRATLEHLESGAIRFKWETSDVIQMAFVQGSTKKTADAAVTSVSADGRTAQFAVEVPEGITGNFTLYAYRSSKNSDGGILSAADPTVAILPTAPWEKAAKLPSQSSLISLWCKQEVTYGGGAMPSVSLAFKHLGAMMTVKIKNTKSGEIKDIKKLYIDGDRNWVFNAAGSGGATYNMQTGSYTESLPNYILNLSYISPIKAGENTFYVWFIPGDYTASNPLKLVAKDNNYTTIGTSSNTKKQIKFQPGINYKVYATLGDGDGSPGNKYTFKFTDSSFN